ncbi:MAG TPA: tRNA (pseudouridine(54)-N(1))-methyltransferase TrmY [Methanobacteriales archaeon]|nr:tRNA (pseudouridine(54)-N(1))-methyltransferase TrmY [Methanobacteriaceae archaeon]MBC7096390.1 tRNA (pseudouridine(54)-N(1))-methyltransferase TrmY [Methanobacteriales archaeon]MDI3484740.1 tRNA (pseudouridine54-N1)-methyltransferase [Methanobacteriaceae archaeon]HIH62011.1 tRNA (pseudouridine(54)-N(1))-methyltransferase TrmY [Methanobacteriales archaeon]
MRGFLVIGNKATTGPFSLKNIPGAGRMDILCRCISQAIFLSHSIRESMEVYLLLLGNPNPPRVVKIRSDELRGMSPDERSVAGLIRKALKFKAREKWTETNSGVFISKKDLIGLLEELSSFYRIYYMREDGKDLRKLAGKMKNPLFVLGDHLGVKKEDEKVILQFAEDIVSISKLSLMAEQCITIANYELDRAAQ